MEIQNIYQKFNIPKSLARHMRTVAQVVDFLKRHWEDESLEIDWELLEEAALLHDIGNIVKFDLEKFPEILESEGEDLEYWKMKQKEMIEKYGHDDHEVTRQMLIEKGTDQKVIDLILNKSFGNSKITASGDGWYAKILLYSDLRVAPWGVTSLEERLDDIEKRLHHYTSRPDYPELLEAVREIERQIQEKINVSLMEMN